MRWSPLILLLACGSEDPTEPRPPFASPDPAFCDDSPAGHAGCAASDPTHPLCLDGECVACGEPGPSALCADADATRPVCEVSGACVGCTEHEDCGSGICDRDQQTCVTEESIVYVDNGGFLDDRTPGDDTPGCGLAERPCFSIGHAVTERIDEGSGRVWIHVADGRYEESALLAGDREVHVVGGPDVEVYGSLNVSEPVFVVGEGGTLHLDRLVVLYGQRSVDCEGEDRNPARLRVERSTLRLAPVCIDADQDCVAELTDVSLERCDAFGIDADHADVTVLSSSIGPTQTGMGIRTNRGSLVLERSVVQGNEDGGIELYWTNFRIRNTVIADNGDRGPAGSSVGGIVIGRDGPDVREFAFNTVAYNRVGSFAQTAPGIDCNTFGSIDIRNSVVWGNRTDADEDAQIRGFCHVAYSNVQDGVVPEGVLTAGPGNIDTDPLFVDMPRANFRLEPTSQAVDAADPEATLDIDFDGNPRPAGSRHDIGAYEVPAPRSNP